jgi:UDP-N-acetyl-D-glucosamine dehydrogenase
MDLLNRIRERRAVIGVLGLGYVGLPLVATFADRGFRVIGLDTDEAKVQSLLAGRSYIRHISADTIATCLAKGFEPTSDFSKAALCDAVLICVPTPLTEHWEPDLQYVVASSETLAKYARPGQLIVLESTTWPGTTDEVMRPIFEQAGHKVGTDVFLAFSPEREDPGNPKFSARNIPKVVGADDPVALEAATALYGAAIEGGVVAVSSTRAAEATKILENTFRAVNIALVNELKMIFSKMGIDVWEVINAAATKPFGFMKFTPGPGLGGHCIPIDPFYLTWKAREFDMPTRFIEMAGEVNRGMPHYVVNETMRAFSDRGKGLAGARLLLIGLAYKKNVDDARESPSYKLIELFEERGASVDYHDSYLPVIPPSREHGQYAGRISQPLEKAGEYDAVVISTDHDDVDYEALLGRARLIVDTRGVYRHAHPRVIKA